MLMKPAYRASLATRISIRSLTLHGPKPHIKPSEGRLVKLAQVAWLDDFGYYLVYPPHHLARPRLAAFRAWLLAEAAAARDTAHPPGTTGPRLR